MFPQCIAQLTRRKQRSFTLGLVKMVFPAMNGGLLGFKRPREFLANVALFYLDLFWYSYLVS
jgi:hypothetical protein